MAKRPRKRASKKGGDDAEATSPLLRLIGGTEPDAPMRVAPDTGDPVRDAAVRCACEAISMLTTESLIEITRVIVRNVRQHGGYKLLAPPPLPIPPEGA